VSEKHSLTTRLSAVHHTSSAARYRLTVWHLANGISNHPVGAAAPPPFRGVLPAGRFAAAHCLLGGPARYDKML
jgi:hypothetical protein